MLKIIPASLLFLVVLIFISSNNIILGQTNNIQIKQFTPSTTSTSYPVADNKKTTTYAVVNAQGITTCSDSSFIYCQQSDKCFHTDCGVGQHMICSDKSIRCAPDRASTNFALSSTDENLCQDNPKTKWGSKYNDDHNLSCDPACCTIDKDCPNNETCGKGLGADNGACLSNKSCDPNSDSGTPTNNQTAQPSQPIQSSGDLCQNNPKSKWLADKDVCDAACCSNDNDCPIDSKSSKGEYQTCGQSIGADNGACRSNKSCDGDGSSQFGDQGRETPVGTEISCPVPRSNPSCGTKFTLRSGCGHCGIGYPDTAYNKFCVPYPATQWGLDVPGPAGGSITLPSLNGNIRWTYIGQELGASTGEAIQKYTGVRTHDGAQFYLQFHHTQPRSGVSGTHNSGEVGGNICSIISGGPCDEFHVHVQLGSGGNAPGNTGWLDVAKILCN